MAQTSLEYKASQPPFYISQITNSFYLLIFSFCTFMGPQFVIYIILLFHETNKLQGVKFHILHPLGF